MATVYIGNLEITKNIKNKIYKNKCAPYNISLKLT